jgi:hypothetical protein
MSDIFNLSLKDFLMVVKKSWLIIFAFSIIGLVGSSVYLLVTPNLYLASGQIQLSQTRDSKYEWVSLEDPNLLIARVKSPTNISNKTLLACQYPSAVDLTKNIQLGIIKTSPPILDVVIKNRSVELSKACVEAVIDEIKASQGSLIAEKSAHYQRSNQDYLVSLKKLKREYSQISLSSGKDAAVDEFVIKEQIRLTTEKIFALNDFTRTAGEGSIKLLAPIYVSQSPVSPKRFISFIVGLLSGIFIGLMIGISRYIYFPRIAALP